MHEDSPPPGASAPVFHLVEDHPHGSGPTLFGFWLYLMSDCLLFAALFATYGVLGGNFAAGPSGADLSSTFRSSRSTPACCSCPR